MIFYIALCEIKLCLLLQSRNSVPVSCIMVFCVVLCFSVLNYGKVIYAYVISYMALSVQNLVTSSQGSSPRSKWRSEKPLAKAANVAPKVR